MYKNKPFKSCHLSRYPVSRHGDFGHPAIGHLTSDIWTLDTGVQDIYCQNGPWTPNTKFELPLQMKHSFGDLSKTDNEEQIDTFCAINGAFIVKEICS